MPKVTQQVGGQSRTSALMAHMPACCWEQKSDFLNSFQHPLLPCTAGMGVAFTSHEDSILVTSVTLPPGEPDVFHRVGCAAAQVTEAPLSFPKAKGVRVDMGIHSGAWMRKEKQERQAGVWS